MGAVRHALAAVETDEGVPRRVQVNGVHRAGPGAFAAADAEILAHNDAAAPALGIGPGGTGRGAGGGVQARQVRASKPVDRPPEEAMRMPAMSQDRR